jgi:phage/plasmid primase-like uncharacterized protein
MNDYQENRSEHFDKDLVKQEATGRWKEILIAAGISPESLVGRNHPSPKCGGTDRFAAFPDVNERGSVNCRQCFAKGADGLATVKWFTDKTFPEAVNWIGEFLGLASSSASQQEKGYDSFCDAYKQLGRLHGQCTSEALYRNNSGESVCYVMRWDKPDGGKEIRPLSLIDGSWQAKWLPDARPLYHSDSR